LLLPLLLAVPLCAEEAKPYPSPETVRASFKKMLDRPAVPLNPQAVSSKTDGKGRTVEVLTIATEKKADGKEERMPVLIVKPAKASGKMPVMIVLHGTGGSKDGMRTWLEDLADRGIMGVAIDARYHGDRSGGARGAAAYNEAIVKAWQAKPGEAQEHPFYYDTVWDLWKLVDYLLTREDVDGDKIGMMGVSMGGIETWLAATADERVKVLVPLIGVQSFRWSLDNNKWQARANTIKAAHEAAAKDLGEKEVNAKVCKALWNKVIPGMLEEFDCPSMLRLAAGRPLLILNGEEDPNCPVEGAKLAVAAAEAAYKEKKASDKLKVVIAPGVKHQVTADMRKEAIDWCVKWLK
jgi:dienelactone hydrolase